MNVKNQRLKIIILFGTMLAITFCGWKMYQKLKYNQAAYSADIYAYTSPTANQIINIERAHHLEGIGKYNADFNFITTAISQHLSYPMLITTFNQSEPVLLMRTSNDQHIALKKTLLKNIATNYPPKISMYKDVVIYVYPINNYEFLSYTRINEIVGFSKSYTAIQNLIDIDPENTFFSSNSEDCKKIVQRLQKNSPISLFINIDNNLLACEYIYSVPDSILLDGYLLKTTDAKEGYDKEELLIKINSNIEIPENYCLDYTQLNDTVQPRSLKIGLAKIEE